MGLDPWLASAAFFLLAAVLPLPPGLSRPGAHTLAAVASTILFWGSGVQDPALTGLLIVSVLALLRVMPFEDAVAGFGTEFVWLLAATFVITQAMAETGLSRRLALRIPASLALLLLTWAAALFYWPLLGYRP